MGIGREEAARIALAEANRAWGYPHDGEELVILQQYAEESEVAWAFTYNTRSFAETGDVMRALMGNGAVVISKATGLPTLMGSSYNCREALRVWQTQQAN